ncbi:MAG TPA: hypothetical protein VLT33_39240 [Labilithrix sp.]|nr:hypothetical protein [Labilithrix sp.]
MTLDRIVVDVKGGPGGRAPVVVLLHGFCGLVDDLAPFARSLGIAGRFVVPHGLEDMAPRGLRGRAWWPIDVDARDAAMARGEPRDLSAFVPEGLTEARVAIGALLDELALESPGSPLVLGGFSQGGMLSCEVALRTDRPLAAIAVFSGARIAQDLWRPRLATRAGLAVFMSHGRSDPDLSFAAAESFKDELVAAGLRVEWCPFDGGHEIPLVVLRAFKKFLKEL